MQDLDPYDVNEAVFIVFRDVIMLALLGFVTSVVLLLPHVNPPQTEAKETGPMPGDMIVEIRWPDELDTDVDLWVKAPGDRPVGYSNRGGLVFNLLRDDLGHSSDLTKLNYEFAYTRGAPAGEYVVNVHLYRNMAKLEHIGLPFAPIAKPHEMFDDPHLNAGGGLVPLTVVDGEKKGAKMKLPALPLEMAGKRLGVTHDIPRQGQHTREILKDLGYSAETIEAMMKAAQAEGE